jgi:hypothetical protein
VCGVTGVGGCEMDRSMVECMYFGETVGVDVGCAGGDVHAYQLSAENLRPMVDWPCYDKYQ